jgi:hypothetical protein
VTGRGKSYPREGEVFKRICGKAEEARLLSNEHYMLDGMVKGSYTLAFPGPNLQPGMHAKFGISVLDINKSSNRVTFVRSNSPSRDVAQAHYYD